MNYSTFKNRTFYIKQNSTLPEVKYRLIQQLREKYDITDEMLEDVAVTFSMVDEETGIYQIANSEGDLVINANQEEYPDEEKYTLTYRFKKYQTKKTGIFRGEFVVDFLGENGCGKIKFPVDDVITIIIKSSITKTTVI